MTKAATATTAREKPIIFSGAMIRAILDGRKTVTRRVVKPQPGPDFSPLAVEWYEPAITDRDGEIQPGPRVFGAYDENTGYPSPYEPGMRLWCRETWQAYTSANDFGRGHSKDLSLDWTVLLGKDLPEGAMVRQRSGKVEHVAPLGVIYRADDAKLWHDGDTWRTPIFMPRWASRITLEITDVRVERLHEISEADVLAEGLKRLSKDDGRTWKYGIPDGDGLPGADDHGWPWADWDTDPVKAFAYGWDRINGKRKGARWADRPWVWVVEFCRVEEVGR